MAYKTLDLDLSKDRTSLPIIVYGRVADADMQTITINVTSRDVPFDLTGFTITFEGITSGKLTKVFDVSGVKATTSGLKKGTFDYTFPNMAFAVSGNYEIAYFSIVKGDLRDTTGDFTVIVDSNADIDAKEAETIITEYNKLVKKLNDITDKYIADADVKFNEIDAEIILLQSKIAQYNLDVQKTSSDAISKVNEVIARLDASDFYTKSQTEDLVKVVDQKITTHAASKTNPHSVTASQIGAYSKTEIDTLITQVKLAMNPVGTVLSTLNSANPSTYIGGTWVRYGQGKTLVGVDESDPDFSTTGKTGGEKSHSLTADEMKHVHSQTMIFDGTYKSGNGLGYTNGGTVTTSNVKTGTAIDVTADAHNNLQPYITVYFWRRTA